MMVITIAITPTRDIDIDFVIIHRTQGITNFMRMEMKMTSC
jgi:hypothetical protein